MSTKLDDLFAGASPDPADVPDVQGLWTGGRRRRRVRQAGAVLGSLAVVAVVGVAATGLDSIRTPTVDTASSPEREAAPDAADVEPDPPFVLEREPTELAEVEPLEEEPAPRDEADDAGTTEPEETTEQPAAPAGPEPDAARVADPCAVHRDGQPRVFIDVVAPVAGQQTSGSVELVGCASVFEATVRYRLTGPGGAVLVDSFTTATAGGPEVGEFRETIPVEQGEHTLEVFWDSPKDGSEQDRTAIVFQAG